MNRDIRGLHEAAYVLALFAFFSQLLAIVRDRSFAHFFGAGTLLDAYFAAFKIPDLLFTFFGLFASSFALIPLIASRGGVVSRDSRSLLTSVFVFFGAISIFISVALFFLLPFLIPLLFPGFDEERMNLTILFSTVLLLQPFLLGLSSIVASAVQSARKFALFAIAPILYNLGIIGGVFFLYPVVGPVGVAWGVVGGAFLHLSIQALPLFFASTPPVVYAIPKTIFFDVARVVRASLPRTLALSSHQVLLIILIATASLSAPGAVAAFSFAFNLQSVPLSIVGVSYASALFPSLAALFVKGEKTIFIQEVWSSVRHIVFWTAPLIALVVVLRAHIVRVILGTGAFSWSDTRLTAALLAAFVISLTAQSVILIFSRAYYAASREWTPIIVNVGTAIFAGAFSLLAFFFVRSHATARFFFEDMFRIQLIPGSDIVVIPLVYSFVVCVAACVFAVRFSYDFGFEKRVFHTLFCAFSSAVIGAFSSYTALRLFGPLLPTDTFIGIFTQGIIAGVVGIAVWAGVAYLLKSVELDEVGALVRRFISKKIYERGSH